MIPKLKHLMVSCVFWALMQGVAAQAYRVHYAVTGADSVIHTTLKTEFTSSTEAGSYVAGLPGLLQTKGFLTASIDKAQFDSSKATVHLYVGDRFQWARIRTRPADADLLEAVHWPSSPFRHANVDFSVLKTRQEQILDFLEQNGYPFAKVYLDSITLVQNEVSAVLQVNRGPVYKIDSILVHGNVQLSNEFLERYLEIPKGSLYNKKKLAEIDRKLLQIAYLEAVKPAGFQFTATGLVVHLHVKSKKSSQANVLVGFLPNSNPVQDRKFLITGEANVLLRNSLGAGESIGLNWQQLQVKSPRLHVLYDHPFVFRSPLGLNFTFDMFRKDSTYINIDMHLGAGYIIGGTQSAQVFLKKWQTIVNGVDTVAVRQTRRLPPQGDVRSTSLGVSYSFNNTNYRFNPQKGNEVTITAAAGIKNLKKNNQILELKDPYQSTFSFESLYDTVKLQTHQLRITAAAAHYFKTGRQTTVKAGINAGVFQSGNYFVNELFMIGGYKLLRGFTEESQFVAQYAVATLEYRYLVGLNSNFFAFVDGGWTKNPLQITSTHTYLGTGLGLSFETGAGIFNLAWAVGLRDDTPLNLRQSKIHFGFVNYF